MGWNALWATNNIEGMSEVDLHNELRLCLIEKRKGIHASVSTWFYTTPIAAGDLLTNGWPTFPDQNNSWYEQVDEIIIPSLWNSINFRTPAFINHLDNSGNWEGQTSIPYWTWTSIMAQLGETKIDVPVTKALVRPWALQRYKVLNLYGGIGGNRKHWKDVDVTMVELNPEIAAIYQDFFPGDKVIICDAHQYLLDHFKEFDFIWSSPPCPDLPRHGS